jgi:hypothetical protein
MGKVPLNAGLALTLTLRAFAAVDPAKLFAFALETLQVLSQKNIIH